MGQESEVQGGVQVSLIATVFNERSTIDGLLDSIMQQTRLPDEIVICDGGSTDGTADYVQARLEAWPDAPRFRVLVAPGANISRGRNLAIAAAAGPVIAATDAGVRLEPQWLAELVAPWDNAADWRSIPAVAGFFVPDTEGADTEGAHQDVAFMTAMAATVLPLEEDIEPAQFLPSSRSVAFLKDTWAAAGGYPEWLDYCEDLIFDLQVNRLGEAQGHTGFVWQPRARVHFRPRGSVAAFWRQYYLYARGDGKADLWRKRHALRYVVYGVLGPALVGHALAGRFAPYLGWVGLLLGFCAYMLRPWQRVLQLGDALSMQELMRALLLVPVIRVTGDLAKMAGYPVGLWWRWQQRGRAEIRWRQETTQHTDITPL